MFYTKSYVCDNYEKKRTKITTKKFVLLSESVDENEINCDRKYKTHTLVVAGTTQTSP